MKTFVIITGIFFSLLSCSSQIFLDPAALNSAIEKKEFNYNATRTFPTNYDVIKVMNSIPNSTSTRLLNLDPGYGFELKKDQFRAYLPYFGRAYNINPGDAANGGIRFESKDFSVKQTSTKKGNTIFVISTNDQSANFVFNLEIYKNGSAFLSVNSDDRQPICFDGNISTSN